MTGGIAFVLDETGEFAERDVQPAPAWIWSR